MSHHVEWVESEMSNQVAVRISGSRIAFVAVSWAFSEIVRYIYVDVFATPGLYDYMGIRALPVSTNVQTLFQLLALLPSVWLPVHLRRPTDAVQLFLFYAVHIPTCVLLPVVSLSSFSDQFVFAIAILLGLTSFSIRNALPRLPIPHVRFESRLFWSCVSVYYIYALAVFASSGYLTLSNFTFVEVYGQRLELAQRANEIGASFFYVANWTGAALAPFLIIVGLHKRRLLPVVAGLAIAIASFLASSNKANYMAIPAVIAGYAVFRMTKGRHIAAIMGASFLLLAAILRGVDLLIGRSIGSNVSIATWSVFHRAFTNNGFLSSVYLDLFNTLGPALYSDSFLRWIAPPRFDSPIAQLAGASFTDVPEVHANANMWADGYVNLGYAGIGFSALSAILVLWLYDHLSAQKDQSVTAAALVVPASVLANASVHTALISNGMIVVFILVWLWRGGDQPSSNETP